MAIWCCITKVQYQNVNAIKPKMSQKIEDLQHFHCYKLQTYWLNSVYATGQHDMAYISTCIIT
eukprot:UN09478